MSSSCIEYCLSALHSLLPYWKQYSGEEVKLTFISCDLVWFTQVQIYSLVILVVHLIEEHIFLLIGGLFKLARSAFEATSNVTSSWYDTFLPATLCQRTCKWCIWRLSTITYRDGSQTSIPGSFTFLKKRKKKFFYFNSI